MTAIIGFVHGDKAYLAGERANSDDSSLINSITKKVHNIGPYIYGFAGTTGHGQYIKSGFSFPTPPKGIDMHDFLTSSFLPSLRKAMKDADINTYKEDDGVEIILGYKNRIFEISSYDYQCVEYSHTAIGSGREYCLGAYHILKDHDDPIYISQKTIEAAILYSPSCSGQIDIVST